MSCNKPYPFPSTYRTVVGSRYKPGFRFQFKPGVDPHVRKMLLKVARWFKEWAPIKHQIRVTVVPNPVIATEMGEAFGVFGQPFLRSHYVRIMVAAQVPKSHGWHFDCVLGNICVTFLHELVHYEQWRDRGNCSERGVEQRAAALGKRVAKEIK